MRWRRHCHRLLRRRLYLGDLGGYLLGRLGGLRRERLYFPRDHGESTACLPGSRGLDRGVQRQQIGLAGDVADEAHHLVDMLRGDNRNETIDVSSSPVPSAAPTCAPPITSRAWAPADCMVQTVRRRAIASMSLRAFVTEPRRRGERCHSAAGGFTPLPFFDCIRTGKTKHRARPCPCSRACSVSCKSSTRW